MTRNVLVWVVRGFVLLVVAALAAVPRPAVAGVPAPGPVVAAGWFHTCVVRSSLFSGGAACWGQNTYGQLGDGTTIDRNHPVAVDTSGVLNGVTLTQIAAGGDHTCALSSAGRAYCWGDNIDGELGNGTTVTSDVPVAVDVSGALAGVTLTRISLGYGHTCALSSTGHAYCWGYGDYGAVGDGGFTSRHTPVAVSGGLTFTDLFAASYQVCAVSSGHAYCWGYNGAHDLGDGTTTDRGVPTLVDASGPLNGVTVTQVTHGEDHGCALAASGTVSCWGANGNGQLGDGTTTDEPSPVAVTGAGRSRVVAGDVHTCVLTTGNQMYCWGGNNRGQLGDGTNIDRHTAVAVDVSGALSGKTVVSISAAGDSTCVTTALHGVYCWGDDRYGQLGDNDTIDRNTPYQVVAEDTLPASPTNVHAVPGDGSATVSWDLPGSMGNGTFTEYTVTAVPGGHTCTTTGTSCVVSGLSGGTAYSFTVATSTTVGESDPSAASGAVTVTGLATTGQDIALMAATGLALLAAGLLLVVAVRGRTVSARRARQGASRPARPSW